MKLSERVKGIIFFVPALILLTIAKLLDSNSFTRPLLEWLLRPRGFNFDNLKNADKVVVKIAESRGSFTKSKTIDNSVLIRQIIEVVGTAKAGRTLFYGTDPAYPYANSVTISFFVGDKLLKTFGIVPDELYSWNPGGVWRREFKEGEYEYLLKLLDLKSKV
jgi:hypothetical protein